MRSRTALLAVVAVVLLVVGAGALAWVLFLKGDDVAPLTLPSAPPAAVASQSTGGDTSAGSSDASADPSLAPASGAAIDAAAIPGTWSIAPDSLVGYRVRERLASLSADSDAVGRTDAITGTATIAGSGGALTLSDASFNVDMTSLHSDRPMRDNRLRNDGVQTDQFPTSTFKLTTPVTIPANATTGAAVDVTLHGDLTLHGVTKTVDIPARAQLNGNLIQVAGSLSFPFSDYQINPPNIANFVAVQDTGTLEFLINLAKA
jgi:polyisoprenoid-binding protein YceI